MYKYQTYVYPFQASLNLNQKLLGQVVYVDSDSDFILRAIWVYAVTPLTSFTFQFASNDFYFSNSYALQTLNPNVTYQYVPFQIFSANAGQPYPIVPEVLIPAGGVIKIDLANTNNTVGGPNVYGINFLGVKRYQG